MSQEENSNDECCRLFLAGTVALPPAPIVGTLKVEASSLPGVDEYLLHITQSSAGQQTIVRKVLLKHVCAVEVIVGTSGQQVSKQSQLTDEVKKKWFLGTERIKEHFEVGKKGSKKTSEGTAYVPEGVSVWIQADFAVTAADAAEYRAPRSNFAIVGCDR
jgi:hypothetical protein